MNAFQNPSPNLSHRGRGIIILIALATMPSLASAQSTIDRIRRQNGVDSGQITAVTPLGVTISKSGVESTVPAEEIEAITFAGEPGELNSARNALQAGRAQDAVESLAKITVADVSREEILADVAFYTALAKAQLALAGNGDLTAAATDVRNFMAKHGKNFHVPQAIETLGDLLAADKQMPAARAEYAKLAKAKSPYFESKSALLVGRTFQAEGDPAKAQAEFDKVIASTDGSDQLAPLKLAATLERAVSQAGQGQAKEATAAISDIIAQAKPEDAELLARAYNALGDSYLQAKDPRGALFAFLHVDLLYSQNAEAHAKALHELIPLWKSAGRDSRSQEAAQKLAQKYPGSRWAK